MADSATNSSGVLDRSTIRRLIDGAPPLLSEYVNLSQQLQPNGFDLTVRTVARFADAGPPGQMGISDADRRLSETAELPVDGGGWWTLEAGPYLITLNEIVSLPKWLMALVRPRSSLLRSGVAIHTAVWDAGYAGRSQALLNVHHPQGFRLQQNARVAQMVFIPLAKADAVGYAGRYQMENL